MVETLSETFQRTLGAPIELDGRTILPIFKMRVAGGRKSFVIRRLEATSSSVTGLHIKAVKGTIEVSNQCHSEIVLWADTSPETVVLAVHSKSECELKMWNVWRAGDFVQAWVGNAGMAVSQSGLSTKLECSGGDEEINFVALVVQIDKIES